MYSFNLCFIQCCQLSFTPFSPTPQLTPLNYEFISTICQAEFQLLSERQIFMIKYINCINLLFSLQFQFPQMYLLFLVWLSVDTQIEIVELLERIVNDYLVLSRIKLQNKYRTLSTQSFFRILLVQIIELAHHQISPSFRNVNIIFGCLRIKMAIVCSSMIVVNNCFVHHLKTQLPKGNKFMTSLLNFAVLVILLGILLKFIFLNPYLVFSQVWMLFVSIFGHYCLDCDLTVSNLRIVLVGLTFNLDKQNLRPAFRIAPIIGLQCPAFITLYVQVHKNWLVQIKPLTYLLHAYCRYFRDLTGLSRCELRIGLFYELCVGWVYTLFRILVELNQLCIKHLFINCLINAYSSRPLKKESPQFFIARIYNNPFPSSCVYMHTL